MSNTLHLGFPAPLLGERPLRLPVVFDDGDLLALTKPSGVLVRQDSWYPRIPVLVEAILYQAAADKPEFTRMGIPKTGLWAVNDLDPECLGPVLFARNRDTAEALRDACGSNQVTFDYELIGKGPGLTFPISCGLPMSRHHTERRMLVSHTTGKKAETVFEFMRNLGKYQLVSARTTYTRHHQLLLHAVESGFRVLGDTLYSGIPLPFLSHMKKDYRPRKDRDEMPLYPGPAYRLKSIHLPDSRTVECPAPRKWSALARQLSRHR